MNSPEMRKLPPLLLLLATLFRQRVLKHMAQEICPFGCHKGHLINFPWPGVGSVL